MELQGYRHTMRACFVGYIVQAVVNNFLPLLFVTFHQTYHLPMEQITLLVTVNFAVQLLVDLLSAGAVDRVGYRAAMVFAHGCAAAGLALLAVLPEHCAEPFAGILVCVVLYAVGGGLLEVLVSPIVEACPTENKETAMSLLHSFYCWGQAGVVLLSTLFFLAFGTERWAALALLWALLPAANLFVFLRVPIAPLQEEGESGPGFRALLSSGLFWVLVLLMVCAGASEQTVSQWASSFAEQGLGVSKAAGDLAGPMAFALLMGLSRALYGKFGARLPLRRVMAGSGALCAAAYLLIVFAPWPALSLAGCALCGFSVGILWPGGFSIAASSVRGGTAMFALLALAGDLGCAGGPTLAGAVAGMAGNSLRAGILAALIFPLLLLVALALCAKGRK